MSEFNVAGSAIAAGDGQISKAKRIPGDGFLCPRIPLKGGGVHLDR